MGFRYVSIVMQKKKGRVIIVASNNYSIHFKIYVKLNDPGRGREGEGGERRSFINGNILARIFDGAIQENVSSGKRERRRSTSKSYW